ncbi:hypothetical protein ACQ4PT_031659 [Festuca glaucescens]
MPSAHMFESDDDEFAGPISFKRSKPNRTPQPRRKGSMNMKRTHEEDDHPMPETDSDDDKPIASRRKAGERKPKRINTRGAKADDDDPEDEKPLASRLSDSAASKSGGSVYDGDDSEDDTTLAARFSRIARGVSSSNSKPIPPSNKGLSHDTSAPRNSVKGAGDRNSQTSSALKKAKPSEASTSVAVVSVEREHEDDGDDNIPLARRRRTRECSKCKPPAKNIVKDSPSPFKKDEQTKVNMRTEENPLSQETMEVCQGSDSRKKWSTLEHNGVIFPPPYEPHGVKMIYNGQPVDLTPEQEEVATTFAVMKDTEYASKETFINNFFNDWRNILGKKHIIKKFELCDFTPIYEWNLQEKEKKKQMTPEEKKTVREEKLEQEKKFMWAFVDGVEEKVGNFRVEPPGLFRGRGEHPKMGRLKRRIRPSDITINIGEGAPVPVCPILGESWKEVKHDNTITWLAFWNDPTSPKDYKYVFLAASSSLKGKSDKEKYEKARKLKDEDEADTVGCCTLKVENVTCLPPNKLQFDFLGKDSIRYLNTVDVKLPVYEAVKGFCAGKAKGGRVFDKLDTIKLNAHLKNLMPGLTAKVFRTYNASVTLDTILNKETKDGTLLEKHNVYQRANKEVAIICNHQRAVPKSYDSQITKLNEQIDQLKASSDKLKVELKKAKKGKPRGGTKDGKRKRKLTPQVYISES